MTSKQTQLSLGFPGNNFKDNIVLCIIKLTNKIGGVKSYNLSILCLN